MFEYKCSNEISAEMLDDMKNLYLKDGAPPPIYKQTVVDSGAFQSVEGWTVCFYNGVLAGMYHSANNGTMSELVVDEKLRRHRVATGLIKSCYDQYRNNLNLSVIGTNLHAIALYNSLPFLVLEKTTHHVSLRDGCEYQLLHYRGV